jgi:transposase-like protein
MRFNTIRLLTWGNVDFNAHSLTVGKDKSKAGTGRGIPLNQRAYETLHFLAEQFPNRKPEHYVFPSESVGAAGDKFEAKSYNTDPSSPVGDCKEAWEGAKKRTRRHCPHCEDGTLANNPKSEEGFTCTNCQAAFKELPPGVQCRMHDLRHTFVSRALEAGVSIAVVARIVGWSAGTMAKMAMRYGHFRLDDLRSAMETVTKTAPEKVVFGETYPQFPPRKTGGAKQRVC